MRQKLCIIAALAVCLLACLKCAPDGRKKQGKITKPSLARGGQGQGVQRVVLGPDGKPVIGEDGNEIAADSNGNPLIGKDGKPVPVKAGNQNGRDQYTDRVCTSAPKQVSSEDIEKNTKKRADYKAITFDSLPLGEYTLKGIGGIYAVPFKYESEIDYAIQAQGAGEMLAPTCLQNVIGQKNASQPSDGNGRSILIDSKFTLVRNNGPTQVQNGEQIGLTFTIGQNGSNPNMLVTDPTKPESRISSGSLSLINAIRQSQPDAHGKYSKVYEQPSVAILSQVPDQANTYQVFLEFEEGSSALRQYVLIYSLSPEASQQQPIPPQEPSAPAAQTAPTQPPEAQTQQAAPPPESSREQPATFQQPQ